MKQIFLYVCISTCLCTAVKMAKAQETCVETVKEKRKSAFGALQTGDKMLQIDTQAFKAAIVVFYKTDCPFCERLMPELKKLYDKYIGSGFAVYAICLDENITTWKAYTNGNGYNHFHNYCDGQSYAGSRAEAYHVFATPSLFLLNNQWCIAAKPKTPKQLEEEIIKLCR